MKNFFFLLVMPTILSISFMNCSRTPLEKIEKVVAASLDPEATFCVSEPKEIGKYTKILFVMDVSGSNVANNPPLVATDPQAKSRRLSAMRTFFEKHKANVYLKWGLEVFSGSVEGAAKHLIREGADAQNFGDAEAFERALTEFLNTQDDGGTPYTAALDAAENALEKSIALAKEKKEDIPRHHIVFISDGVPYPGGREVDLDIYDRVSKMIKLSEGSLKLSTVFYNVPENLNPGSRQTIDDAIDRLREMANLGGGKFQDASNGEDINIEGLIEAGTFKEPYFIKDVFVYNLNSAVCDDGFIKADSDGDGLCDEDEIRYNQVFKNRIDASTVYRGKVFSPTNRNSFDLRFSDLFMLKHIIDDETLPSCELNDENVKVDADQDLLNSCEERFLYNSAPQGPTDEWTESMTKNGNFASSKNFDSDGDGMLDSLEFLFFKNKGYATSFNTSSVRMYGRTMYDYFKNHQSILKPEATLPYNIKVTWIKKNDSRQNCYRIDQENLPVYKVSKVTVAGTADNLKMVHNDNENVILVYYIMTTENDPDGKGVMRFSYQKRSYNTDKPISFNDARWDEVIAK